MGSIIRRKDSKYLWLQYFKNGKKFMESSKTTKFKEAEKLLKIKEGDLACGKPATRAFDDILFSEICKDFLADRIASN